jgi:dipeptidyl aminopeptidase/acylaminoacyl peptidase
VLDGVTGEETSRFEQNGEVLALVFSPDGTRLAIGGDDNAAKVLKADTGEEIGIIDHDGTAYTVSFSPDGTRVAVGSGDGDVRIVPTVAEEVFAELCGDRAGRNLTQAEWERYIGQDEKWQPTCPEWRTVGESASAGVIPADPEGALRQLLLGE